MNKFNLITISGFFLIMMFVVQARTAPSSSASSEAPAMSATSTTAIITYTPLDTPFANPERGFYHYLESRASAPNSWNLDRLTRYRTEENITLTYCIIYLDTFQGGPISADYLSQIDSNLATIRQAGLKCLLRFAYTSEYNDGTPPFDDAPKAIVLQHIDQLGPILQKNGDVIALLQAGFIGVWGEWYYTQHFVDDPAVPWEVTAEQWQDRLDVIEAEAAALPHRFIAVRYAHAKTNLFDTATPITADSAHNGSTFARTTFHNDCFLASNTDFGTYFSAEDRQFMVDDTKFGAMGGETCNPNPPRSDCATALAELAEFHYSYLNIDYRPEVLDGWRTGGCFDTIEKELGYRLELLSGEFSDSVAPGGQIGFGLTLRNSGYAAPFNPRPVQVLLRNTAALDQIYTVTLPDDPRKWFAQETQTLNYDLCLPSTMPVGSYELLLNLPDGTASLAQSPAYSILVANGDGVPESATGFNRLKHQLAVQAGGGSADCTSSLSFGSLSGTPSAFAFLPLITAGN